MESKETALAVQSGPSDLLNIIERIVDKGLNAESVSALEKMLNMQERIIADQRKTAFMAAMSRLQAKLPQINKDGRIVVKGVERSRYARIEDVDIAIRPLLTEEGFSFSFDEESSTDKAKRFSCKLSHRDGYSETKYLTVPIDTSDFRTGIQSVGSTTSYARRYLIKMHLNLMEKGEDNDGNDVETITDDQVKDLETQIADTGMDLKRFLVFMGVGDLKDILKKDMAKAQNAIDVKRADNQKKAK